MSQVSRWHRQNHSVSKIKEISEHYLHPYFRGTSQTCPQCLHSLLSQVFGETKTEMCIPLSLLGHLAAGLGHQIYH